MLSSTPVESASANKNNTDQQSKKGFRAMSMKNTLKRVFSQKEKSKSYQKELAANEILESAKGQVVIYLGRGHTPASLKATLESYIASSFLKEQGDDPVAVECNDAMLHIVQVMLRTGASDPQTLTKEQLLPNRKKKGNGGQATEYKDRVPPNLEFMGHEGPSNVAGVAQISRPITTKSHVSCIRKVIDSSGFSSQAVPASQNLTQGETVRERTRRGPENNKSGFQSAQDWAPQLAEMEKRGWLDKNLNIQALKRTSGSVDGAVRWILTHYDGTTTMTTTSGLNKSARRG